MISRREFVSGTAAMITACVAGKAAMGNPLGLPLGIQLYSVREQMAQDFEGALAAVAGAGYTEVEAAALPKKSAREIRSALDKAGLRCVSAHHPFGDLHARFDELVAFDKEIGVQFVICSSSGFRNPIAKGEHREFSLDDWHYNAEQLNVMGEKSKPMGVRFGYHNHSGEFDMTEGKVPLFELLRITEPDKVTFEMDCGWVVVGGASPVEVMQKYPHRFSMLHVKDFHFEPNAGSGKREAKVTELGRGTIDYKPIFAQAAKNQHIQHAFVEQEAFDIPWKESLKVDADYMKKL